MLLSAALAIVLCACGAEPTQPKATLAPTGDPAATIAEVDSPDGTLKLTVGDSVQLGTATDPSAGKPTGRSLTVSMFKVGPYTQVRIRSTADFDARRIVASTAVLHTATGAPVHVARRADGGLIMAMQGLHRTTAYYYFSTAALAPGRSAPPFSSLVFEARQTVVGRVVGTVSGTAPSLAPGRWTSTAPRVASVTASGLAVARSVGVAKLVWTRASAADTVPVRVTAPAPSTPEPHPTGDVYTVPASIREDCRVDVTRAMQAWIRSVPDSSTLAFAKDACYEVDGGLVVSDRHELTFEGNGATFRAAYSADRKRSFWKFLGGSEITLRDMTVIGPNTEGGVDGPYLSSIEAQHGYEFQGTQGATLEDVQAFQVYGDCVYAGGDPVRNLTVRRLHCERTGRHGLGLTNVDGALIEDSYIGAIRWSGIDLEPAEGWYDRNIVIRNNKFGAVRHFLLTQGGKSAWPYVGNNEFSGNVQLELQRSANNGVLIMAEAGQYIQHYTIKNNTFLRPGPRLVRVKGFAITGNTINFDKPESTIDLLDVHDGRISDNDGGKTRMIFQVDAVSTNVVNSGGS
jgi:hypothetical protein